MKNNLILSFIILTFFATSCNNKPGSSNSSIFSSDKFDEEEFTANLKTALKSSAVDSSKAKIASVTNELINLYNQNEYAPLWLDVSGNTEITESFLKELALINLDGINPERYQLTALQQQLNNYKTKDVDISAIISLDTALTANYLKASKELLFGIVSPEKVDSLWYHPNDSVWNVDYVYNALKAKKYPSLDSYKSAVPIYTILKKGLKHYSTLSQNTTLANLKNSSRSSTELPDSIVTAIIDIETPWLNKQADMTTIIKSFQEYHGIKRTGKLDTTTIRLLTRDPNETGKIIAANMERVRWLPRNFSEDYIVVNIPTMNFSMKRNGVEVMKMNVVVGKSSRQTPAIGSEMSNIVINPSWGVPPTILKKDVLPGLLKSGAAYLDRKDLEAFDHKGRRVDASVITADNYKRFTFRQAPGHSNALGYVKFNFPNEWNIYMHDTPHREDFEKFDRAKSSGCIRLQHPQELAKYILNDVEGKNYDQIKLDSLISTHKTKSENLKNKIPVHIVYLTAWVDDNETNLRFARDFYKRDTKLMAAISK